VDVDDDGVRAWTARPVQIGRNHALSTGNAVPCRIANQLGRDKGGYVDGAYFTSRPTLQGAVIQIVDIYVSRRLRRLG